MNCTICKLPTGNIVGSVLPQCKCGWQAPQPPVTQRTWVELTDEDVNGFVKQYWDDDHMTMRSMMRAIEAKLKERNT